MWTRQEAVQLRLRVQLLAHVVEAHDDIVATGRLAPTKHATQPERLSEFVMATYDVVLLPELEVLHTVCQQGGKEALDAVVDWELFLVQNNIALSYLSQWPWYSRNILEPMQLERSEITMHNIWLHKQLESK